MKFRNLIFVLTIAFSVIFVGMIGTSYAYYASDSGINLNVTTPDTGVAVVFEQSQYINVNTDVPLQSSVVDTLASKSIFSITPNVEYLSKYDTIINVSIINIEIDEALRISDFKYKFSCTGGANHLELANSDGTSFTDEVISSGKLNLGTLSTTDGTLDINETYSCVLRVWLHETGRNQNHLMNKRFRGLIKVNTIFGG